MVRLLRKKGQPIFITMIFLTLLISVPFQPALAALIDTETAINPDRVRDSRVLLNQLITREDVRTALLSYGINPVEAEARIASLTDEEILSFADHLKILPYAGNRNVSEEYRRNELYALAILFLLTLALWAVARIISLIDHGRAKPLASSPGVVSPAGEEELSKGEDHPAELHRVPFAPVD